MATAKALLAVVRPGNPVFLRGNNFSGRTGALESLLEEVRATNGQPRPRVAFIGAEVYNSISGLTDSVEAELDLHTVSRSDASDIRRLAEEVNLEYAMSMDPFKLSGGEQALLAILSCIALRPRALALDCCLEQVDGLRRTSILEAIQGNVSSETLVMISDNDWEIQDAGIPIVDALDMPIPRPHQSHELPERSRRSADSFAPKVVSPLSFDQVHFAYGKKVVLHGVSGVLAPGTIHLLEGANGAGKSTLSRVLAGVARPARGRLWFNGRVWEPWRTPGRVVAYHFQNPDVQLFEQSVEDEVGSGALDHGTAEAAMSVMGLLSVRKEHPLDLPFVLRKRVALAATFAMCRPWVILDEPSLGQDQDTVTKIAAFIEDLARVGAGVIVITHSARLKGLLASNALSLQNGRLDDCSGADSEALQ